MASSPLAVVAGVALELTVAAVLVVPVTLLVVAWEAFHAPTSTTSRFPGVTADPGGYGQRPAVSVRGHLLHERGLDAEAVAVEAVAAGEAVAAEAGGALVILTAVGATRTRAVITNRRQARVTRDTGSPQVAPICPRWTQAIDGSFAEGVRLRGGGTLRSGGLGLVRGALIVGLSRDPPQYLGRDTVHLAAHLPLRVNPEHDHTADEDQRQQDGADPHR
jgi:hypothetical protein